MLKVVAQSQLSLQALPRLHDLVTAAQGKQSRCHSQLIPEFHPFSKQLVSESQQQGTNPLAPHLGGDSREEPQTGTDGQQSVEGVRKFVMVGVYHTPKQFLSRAKELNTPLMLQTTLNLSRVRLCRLI